MKNCFVCLRKLRFLLHKKTGNEKWLQYIENYCSTHYKNQWCDLLNEHFHEISQFPSCTQEIMRELRSTNISSEIIKTIRKEYRLDNTPLRIITHIFASYVQRRFTDTVNPTQVTINKIITEYDSFLEFMRSLTVIYYKLEERELIGEDQFFRVTLTNFLINCLFECPDFQVCVTHIIKQSCKEPQDRISFNMQKYQTLSIQQYGVIPKFCLNQKTLEQFGIKSSQNIKKPYGGAIQLVRQVIKSTNPTQKLKALQNIISQIQFSIKKFYKENGISEKMIGLDADNAIAIMLYIIVQSNQTQLLSHITTVQNFINKESMSGNSGYCLATYKVCLQFLEKGNIKRCKGFVIPQNQFSLWINVRSYFEQNSLHK